LQTYGCLVKDKQQGLTGVEEGGSIGSHVYEWWILFSGDPQDAKVKKRPGKERKSSVSFLKAWELMGTRWDVTLNRQPD